MEKTGAQMFSAASEAQKAVGYAGGARTTQAERVAADE